METIVIVLSIITAALIARELDRQSRRYRNLEERIKKLEEANSQRLPYRSFEELLDAMAALDKELEERSFYNSLLENAKGHIANAMKVGTKREKDST